MFDEVLMLIDLIKTILQYSFYYSFKTGQYLVYAFNFIFKYGVTCLKYFGEVLVVILESFTVFCQDILQVLQQLLEAIGVISEAISSGVSTSVWSANNILHKIAYLFSQICSIFKDSILNIYTLIVTICKLIKHLLILSGDGVWLTITFIPYSIVSLTHSLFSAIKVTLKTITNEIVGNLLNSRNCIKDIYNFVTDVPVESLIGLIIATCLIYTLTQFYVTVYQSVRQIYFKILSKFNNRQPFIQPRNIRRNERTLNVRSPITRRPQIRRTYEQNHEEPKASDLDADERYCIICQERIKCILVLPCRHVCMCVECHCRLQLYNNTCPICRNDIESTMKIFV